MLNNGEELVIVCIVNLITCITICLQDNFLFLSNGNLRTHMQRQNRVFFQVCTINRSCLGPAAASQGMCDLGEGPGRCLLKDGNSMSLQRPEVTLQSCAQPLPPFFLGAYLPLLPLWSPVASAHVLFCLGCDEAEHILLGPLVISRL